MYFFSVSESRNWKEVIFWLKRKKILQITQVVQSKKELSMQWTVPLPKVLKRDWPPSLWVLLSSDLLWIVLPVTACQHGRPHIPDVESAVLSNSSSITDAVLLLDSWERFNIFDSSLSLGPHTFTSRMFLDVLLIPYLHGYGDSPSLPNPMWTEVIGVLISLESKPGLLIL